MEDFQDWGDAGASFYGYCLEASTTVGCLWIVIGWDMGWC